MEQVQEEWHLHVVDPTADVVVVHHDEALAMLEARPLQIVVEGEAGLAEVVLHEERVLLEVDGLRRHGCRSLLERVALRPQVQLPHFTGQSLVYLTALNYLVLNKVLQYSSKKNSQICTCQKPFPCVGV